MLSLAQVNCRHPISSGKLTAMVKFASDAGSPILLLAICWWAWEVIFRHDWGPGVSVKILLVAGFTWMAVGVGRAAEEAGGARTNWGTIAVGVVSILLSAWITAPEYLSKSLGLPIHDIGQTTLDCARIFWKGEGNPYTSDSINPRPGLPEGFRGFHYGPGILLCYAGGGISRGGYQVFHFLWVAGMILAGMALSARGSGRWPGKLAAGTFFLAVLLSSPGWWKEYFQMGVNDAAPLTLMAASLLLTGKGRWLTGGALAGLAFSAKFSPGGFLLLAMLRRGTPVQFWKGCLIGFMPLLLSMVISPEGSFRNIFLSRLYVEGTPTGLYYLFPESLKSLLPVATLIGMGVVVVRGWGRGHGATTIVSTIAILAFLGIVGHKETHANHLTWLLFFGGILLAVGRERVWTWLAGNGKTGHHARADKEVLNES